MRKDIILSGVGGQGILTIATIIGEAATVAGLNLKQAEVHGMSQRGGDVQSFGRNNPFRSHFIGGSGFDYFYGAYGGFALFALFGKRRMGGYFCKSV